MMALEGTCTEVMDAEMLAKDSIARSQIKEQSHSDKYGVHIRCSRYYMNVAVHWDRSVLVNPPGRSNHPAC